MDGGKLRATVANAVLAAAAALVWTPAGCAAGAAPAREYFASEDALAAAEAIRRRRPAALGRLIAGGLDVDHRGRDGMDLLKWALASGCPKCFEALLEAGAATEHFVAGEYTGKVEQLFLKPLMHLAASARDPRFLALALRHGGDPDALDVYGTKTVIFAAILNSRIENVRLLVGGGGGPGGDQWKRGRTAVGRCWVQQLRDRLLPARSGSGPVAEEQVGKYRG